MVQHEKFPTEGCPDLGELDERMLELRSDRQRGLVASSVLQG